MSVANAFIATAWYLAVGGFMALLAAAVDSETFNRPVRYIFIILFWPLFIAALPTLGIIAAIRHDITEGKHRP